MSVEELDVKECKDCSKTKPVDEFYHYKSGTVYPRCKMCHIALCRSPKVKEYQRDYQLKRHYGISAEKYDSMLKSQDGRCAICRQPPKGKYRLRVDHCHQTGEVRGLLCNPCNSGMGRFQDNPELMSVAVRYLRHAGGVWVRQGTEDATTSTRSVT